MNVNVSVVLIAYHGDKWLPECLMSLAVASSNKLHLILVDNGGNSVLDDLYLSHFNSEVLQTPRSMGFAEANNFALVNASHLEDTVLFLNQDTVNPECWIDNCLKMLEKYENLGAVSPLIRTYKDDGWDPSFLDCLSDQQRSDLNSETIPDNIFYTKNAPAPALIVRTDILRKIGPFDPIYGSYYEDYDLCMRIRNAGYAIGFVTTTFIRHFSGSGTNTPDRENKRMRQIIRNRFIYQLRSKNRHRWLNIIRFFTIGLPHRLLRGILRTSSSQPPHIILQAGSDIGQLIGRISSSKRDKKHWHRYLREIKWDTVIHK